MELSQALAKRKAVREYKKDPVPLELVEKLCYAAAQGPYGVQRSLSARDRSR